MLTLIYGGSGSGKSAYAEQWLMDHRKSGGRNYYLATMQVYDKEGQKRVEKHRQMRLGKGFETAEYPKDVERILEDYDMQKQDSILLECMSNLVANEMFSTSSSIAYLKRTKQYESDSMKEMENKNELIINKIIKAVTDIQCATSHLCIVGNDIFREGAMPTPEMEQYAYVLAEVQRQIAERADQVIEVVYGIPIVQKG